jgi:three-Cys-motif partner protein
MVALEDYAGREQSYVKHIFLERYLETLFFKTAGTYNHIVYMDGFAGPWQSANELFDDTSFGIALNALRQAKDTWKKQGRTVRMTALLVERNPEAYAKLSTLQANYPDITIETYPADFLSVIPQIIRDIPPDAFGFFFIDPKGWRIPLAKLQPLLARLKSEVLFNFMFEFINRAASMTVPVTIKGLDELMPGSNWQQRLKDAEAEFGHYGLSMDDRKDVLVGAFSDSLTQIGGYPYVAELTVLRPLTDRSLYCLVYGSRHETGISVFRDCQMAALKAQAATRAEGKVRDKADRSGQSEMFESLLDMAPDKTEAILEREKHRAADMIRALVLKAPASIPYRTLWATVLAKHAVRRKDVNGICAAMRKSGELLFPDWQPRKQVPQDHYRVQRP